jgi:hypothetical protein
MSNIPFELSIRGMKMLDIGVMFTIGALIGYIFGKWFSKRFVFDKTKYNRTPAGKRKLIFQILLEISLMGMLMYVARQFIQMIPWPFDGFMGINPPASFKGYDHSRVAEGKNPFPIGFFILYYNDSLKSKIVYLGELMKPV